jgi:alpha-galactosidase
LSTEKARTLSYDLSVTITRLHGTGAEVVVDTTHGAPVIVHWGAPLGDVEPASVGAALLRPVVPGGLDVEAPMSVVPEHGSGWGGRPGLQGHRSDGRAWAPRFSPHSVTETEAGLIVSAVDHIAELELITTIRLVEVLEVSCALINRGSDVYFLQNLALAVALPAHADELMSLHGRWAREMHTWRRPWPLGSWITENRTGTTSHEHPPVLYAGERGFGEWTGEVWGVHLASSSNHLIIADRRLDGRRCVQLGELLHPGEVRLEPGEEYRTPTVLATYSASGLTPAAQGFHRWARRDTARTPSPRPVVLNTWEAVYFNHDPDRLRALATIAAEVGIERFVLDDGWFSSRRDARSGLGDWVVSNAAHPDGIDPLIAHVHSLGMQFGIWIEPEMVNPESALYRAHPEWALVTEGYAPVLGRHQLVLDLARPDAYRHVAAQLHRLLSEHAIDAVKWDLNRPQVQGSGAGGAAGAHAQARAARRLLNEMRERHPHIEFESCAAGGGRIDLGIARLVDRFWTSDCNDAVERQVIQRGASLLIPPEMMGCHIGPPTAHTTGRTHTLPLRALTAMFGHLGVEWNLLELDARERDELASVIAAHRRHRALLHSGDVVRFDPIGDPDHPTALAHGVYAPDRSEALVAYTQLRTDTALLPPPLRLPRLAPGSHYELREVGLGAARASFTAGPLTGLQLAVHGFQLPRLDPESGVLVHITRSAAS